MPKNLWTLVVVVFGIALAVTVNLYAGAVARADVYAERVDSLESGLLAIEADTVRLSRLVAMTDSANAARASEDSATLARLRRENALLEDRFRELAAQDTVATEAVEAAVSAAKARLDPEDLPALRRVTSAYDAVVAGLREQIEVLGARLATVEAVLVIERAAKERALEGRRAADALSDGLRGQVAQLTDINDAQAQEIGALRVAVAPGFLTRLGQNIGLVGGTAALASLATYLLTR